MGAPPGFEKPLRVLIVDDNRALTSSLGWLLEEHMFDVATCHNGPECLELAGVFAPDVILLDIGLPVMDGFHVCRTLRDDPQFNGTRIVAQTGYGDDATIARAAAAGFDVHLTKPVEFSALLELLKDLSSDD
ncbi:MAG: response regulator [Asticcacaulis sp.]|nr:response regulator [Asticcacaulis sp.]